MSGTDALRATGSVPKLPHGDAAGIMDEISQLTEWIPPRRTAWQGGPGWHGRAVEACRNFTFMALPWRELTRLGQSAEGITCVKISRSRHVLKIEDGRRFGAHVEGTLYAKRYLINTLRRRMGNVLSGGKAAREFRVGWELLARGFATPEPLAFAIASRRRILAPPAPVGYSRAASFLLTREIQNKGSLRQWVKEGQIEPLDEFNRLLAGFLAHLHAMGFYHDDCSAKNIFFHPSARVNEASTLQQAIGWFLLLDIDHGHLYEGPVPLRRRIVNLFQIMRSLYKRDIQSVERRRWFVLDYLEAAELNPREHLDRVVDGIDRLALRKVGQPLLSE